MKIKIYLFALPIILIIFICGCGKKPAYEWETVGNPYFTPGAMDQISLYVSGSVPYVAFDDLTAEGRAAVMRFNGSSWEFIGSQGFSEGFAGYITLYVNKDVPYAGYSEVPPDGRHFVSPKAMKFTGTEWTSLSSEEIPFSANGSGLYINDSGAYMLSMEKGALKLVNDIWQPMAQEPFCANTYDFASLYVHNFAPYVIYSDTGAAKKAVIKKLDSGKWVKLGNKDISAGEICATSMCFYNYTLYAAFVDKGDQGNARVIRYNGNEWEPVGKPGFSKGQAYYTTLSADKTTLYLSYLDAGLKGVVLRFNGKKWEDISPKLPDGQLFRLTVFAADSVPYIAYTHADKDGNQTKATVMKLKAKK